MKMCEECNAAVTDDEIGHHPDCSKCVDDVFGVELADLESLGEVD